MKIWVNKQVEETKSVDFSDALTLNVLDKNNKSNAKSNIEELWRRFGLKSLPAIYEDLLLIAVSIFCADKRIRRGEFQDNWTRTIEMNIPVLEIEKWQSVSSDLKRILKFLSGDIWNISFRETSKKFRANKENTRYKLLNKRDFEAVSLFSGGLDSFCGALKLMENGKSTCFVGFREYGLLSERQEELFSAIDRNYKGIKKNLITFNVTPQALKDMPDEILKKGTESTSRSRSFLFLAGAIAVASALGNSAPVYIPENGFIGINVPLTDSRNGSCSTRTTHPYFISELNKILNQIGIQNKVINFYATMSKGQIVDELKENPTFRRYAKRTISCSHPCLSRYDGLRPPVNCGYCYPCLIRRASLNKIGSDDTPYNFNHHLDKYFIENNRSVNSKASDLKAVILSLRKYLDNKDNNDYVRTSLLKSGVLSIDDLINYEKVYRASMEELYNMVISNDGGLIDYLGLKVDNNE